jgi:hypothetical protein
MAQLETKAPAEESFIHTRTCSPPKVTYQSMQRDPCNFSENFHKHADVENLWPRLQDKATQVGNDDASLATQQQEQQQQRSSTALL